VRGRPIRCNPVHAHFPLSIHNEEHQETENADEGAISKIGRLHAFAPANCRVMVTHKRGCGSRTGGRCSAWLELHQAHGVCSLLNDGHHLPQNGHSCGLPRHPSQPRGAVRFSPDCTIIRVELKSRLRGADRSKDRYRTEQSAPIVLNMSSFRAGRALGASSHPPADIGPTDRAGYRSAFQKFRRSSGQQIVVVVAARPVRSACPSPHNLAIGARVGADRSW
jgi:hypothetical protein